MHDLKIETRTIEALIPHARNSRTHTSEQIGEIVASIEEFGWTNPVLIDEADGIIAGHGRVLAARRMGLTEVPCISLPGLSDLQKRAYVIADNKLALNAGWDSALLAIEFDDLAREGFDVTLTGFTAEEIEALTPRESTAQPSVSNASLADRFMIPPFSVLNAREGWWQARKRAWLSLGIKSEIGRGGAPDSAPWHGPTVTQNEDGTLNYRGSARDEWSKPNERQPGRKPNASPGGSPRPAADYSKRQRGNGAGRPI